MSLANQYPHPARVASAAVASQSLTVSTSAVAPTGYGDTVEVVIFDVQTEDVRYRIDGTNPTATVGHFLAAGTTHAWSRQRFNAAKFIRDTGATADAVIFSSAMQG